MCNGGLIAVSDLLQTIIFNDIKFMKKYQKSAKRIALQIFNC